MRTKALLLACLISALVPSLLPAQNGGLREKISELFIFGAGQEPLFLAGSASPNNPASLQAHGSHFIPSSAQSNASVISFITDAISGSVANLPIGSTSGGETFRIVNGLPVATSTSAGPIFAERAQTLGRGRVLAGVSRSGFRFSTLRGVDMRNINLAFTHQNVDFPGCSAQFGDDCAKMGVPVLENDVIYFKLSLDIDVRVTAAYLTYGLTDRLDVGVVIPVVQTHLQGGSQADISPFGGTTAAHFFAGTTTDPVLSASRQVEGSASGLGDVALRMKANIRSTPTSGFALLFDARFPTGSAKDELGSGSFAGRGVAVFTSSYGDFSPHGNIGYLYRAGARQNDAVLGTAGFDYRMAERVTLATDLVSELQVGDSKLHLPEPVHYDAPFHRVVRVTDIPDTRDDIVNGSFGFKLVPAKYVTLVLNSLFPLNRGGLRADLIYTAGVEYTF
jgi:hypothetical protein